MLEGYKGSGKSHLELLIYHLFKNPDAARLLNQNRYKFYGEDEALPENKSGLQIVGEKKLAILQGRIKNRPQGPGGSKAYRHGGIPLMEMLIPWLVIKRSEHGEISK